MRQRLPVCLLILGLIVATAAPVAADERPQCGDVITADVVLQEDLHCTSPVGLIVGDPDALPFPFGGPLLSLSSEPVAFAPSTGITVDLNGYTIRYVGDAPTQSVGLAVAEAGEVTVKGGTIVGFDVDLAFGWVNDIVVEEMQLDVLRGYFSDHAVVRNSELRSLGMTEVNQLEIVGNTVQGIGLLDSFFPRIEGNRVTNGGIGLSRTWFAIVRGNHIEGGRFGVRTDTDMFAAHIEENVIRNTHVGVHITAHYRNDDDTVVVRNDISHSAAAGILVEDVSGSISIQENRVHRSGFAPEGRRSSAGALVNDGIHIDALPGGVTVTANTVVQSANHGIYAPGVVDGGDNKAVGTRNKVQCVGVAC